MNIEIIGRGEAARGLLRYERAVGREFYADPALDGVFDDLEEIGAHERLAAADIDIEDLHGREFVDQRLGFLRRDSPGSRRPDDERQWMQARLQP